MAQWLFLFRPETYALVRQHQAIGVRNGFRHQFSAIQPGDRWVCQRAVMSRSAGRDGWPGAEGEQHVETRNARWVARR